MAELVDALDLGSSDLCRVGSSPSARTKNTMDIKELKNTEKLSVEWLVTIPSSKINIELDKKYFELMNKVNLPGFRPGKVPKTIIKKRFGQNVVSEVLDKIINETLTNAVKEKKLKPSGFGTFSIRRKKSRIGRNPKTKEPKVISSRDVVLFKPSKEFKEFINNKND